MQVNVNSLKDNIAKLKSELDSYNLTYLNLYNELNNSHTYANSNKFTKFYNAVEKEKIKTKDFYDEIVELKGIYDYIAQSYASIGKVVEFNLNNDARLYSKLNAIKSKINTVKRKNRSINIGMFPEVARLINDNTNRLRNLESSINTLERNYKNTINRINDIERTTRNKINRLDLSVINETDIHDFI